MASADGHVMFAGLRVRLCVLVVASVCIAACGGAGTLGRDDAIVALQTTGASVAEATCLADTLLILGELDAADPQNERGHQEREALVAATNRCLTGEPDSDVDVEVAGTQFVDPEDSELGVVSSANRRSNGAFEEEDGAASAGQASLGEAEIRVDAIETLVSLGRSMDNATCVVDHIVQSGGLAVAGGANFGLGLDPLEAAAFAACGTAG